MRDTIERRDFQASYVRRVLDSELDELFPLLPAVLIDGPKGVGKTATATERSATVHRLGRDQDRDILAADLGRIAAGPGPVLLDEWHRLPPVWDAVRRHVDEDSSGGRFLLTGSASSETDPLQTTTNKTNATSIVPREHNPLVPITI